MGKLRSDRCVAKVMCEERQIAGCDERIRSRSKYDKDLKDIILLLY